MCGPCVHAAAAGKPFVCVDALIYIVVHIFDHINLVRTFSLRWTLGMKLLFDACTLGFKFALCPTIDRL